MIKYKFMIIIRDISWCFLFTIFMFQNAFNIRIDYFRYTDEIMTLFLGLYTIFYLFKKKIIPKIYFKMYIVMAFLCAVGIISNIISGVSRSAFMIALDIMYLFKVFICFIGASIYFKSIQKNKNLLRFIAFEVRIIVWIAFICLIISQLINIGMTRDIRFGIKCYAFVYSSAGMLSQYCILFLIILTAELAIHRLDCKRWISFIMLIVIWASTVRSRALVMITVWLFICHISRNINMFLAIYDNRIVKKIFRPQYTLTILSIIVLMGAGQLSKYFGNGIKSARNLLVSGGLRIMNDFFPWGAGFGTFGTETAATYYSPLYYQYDLNSFWGLAENGSELTDCYWPAICGELGIIGLALMVILVYLFIRQFYEQSKGCKFFIISSLTYIIYLLISSVATGIFASYVTAEFVIIFAAVISNYTTNERSVVRWKV